VDGMMLELGARDTQALASGVKQKMFKRPSEPHLLVIHLTVYRTQ
jgi:energy-converting hydrogenase Eha subunit H